MTHQQTIEEWLGRQGDFRYSYMFNYRDPEPFIEWTRDTMNHWFIMSYEIGSSGNKHLQCYGERSSEISKGEKQVFQGKGKYRKYLSTEVTKPYSLKPSRKSRYVNVMYVLKHVKRDNRVEETLALNSHIDQSTLLIWIDEAARLSSDIEANVGRRTGTTFQDRLEDWYSNIPLSERPTEVKPCIYRMLDEGVIRWSNQQPDYRLVAAAEHLLMSRHNPERQQAIQRKMSNISDLIEKNYRAYM